MIEQRLPECIEKPIPVINMAPEPRNGTSGRSTMGNRSSIFRHRPGFKWCIHTGKTAVYSPAAFETEAAAVEDLKKTSGVRRHRASL